MKYAKWLNKVQLFSYMKPDFYHLSIIETKHLQGPDIWTAKDFWHQQFEQRRH